MEVYFPRSTPQVCAPTRHNLQFFHLRENCHFEQKFLNTPYVPDGCIYMPHTLGSENQVPKVCFDAILGKKKFWKFYSQILREIGLKVGFGTHFRGVIKFVLGVLYSKYGYSEGGRGRLTGFWGRRTPKKYLHPTGTNGSVNRQNLHFFGRNFWGGVPLGAHTFRWGARPKKGRKGP